MAEHELNKIVDDDGEVFNLRDSTKQPVADRVTAWGSTPSDTKYPSEKLVKDSLDTIPFNADFQFATQSGTSVKCCIVKLSKPVNAYNGDNNTTVGLYVLDAYNYRASVGPEYQSKVQLMIKITDGASTNSSVVAVDGLSGKFLPLSGFSLHVKTAVNNVVDIYLVYTTSANYVTCVGKFSRLWDVNYFTETWYKSSTSFTPFDASGDNVSKSVITDNILTKLTGFVGGTLSFTDGKPVIDTSALGTLGVEHGGTGNTSVDTIPTANSTKMVTSGGIYASLADKLPHTSDPSKIISAAYPQCFDSTAFYNGGYILLYDVTSAFDGTFNNISSDQAHVAFSGFVQSCKYNGYGEPQLYKVETKVNGKYPSNYNYSTSKTYGPVVLKRTFEESGVTQEKYYLAIKIPANYNHGLMLFGVFHTRGITGTSLSWDDGFIGTLAQSSDTEYTVHYSWTAGYNVAASLFSARKLAVSLSNTSTDTSFNGSADVTNIKTTGTLPLDNGGTGKTTAKAAEYNLTTGKSEISDTTSGDDRVVFELASPSERNGVTRGFRKLSTIWTWIKGLLSSESDVNISGSSASCTGNAATATALSAGADRTKLDGIASGAEVNVQSDWNQATTTADDYIKNKPTTMPPSAHVHNTDANEVTANDVASELNVITDTTEIVTTNTAGYSSSDKKLYRRPAGLKIWPWIKDKISSVLGLSESNGVKTFTGNASSATTISSHQLNIINDGADVYVRVGEDSNKGIALSYDDSGSTPNMGLWVRWASGSGNGKYMCSCDTSGNCTFKGTADTAKAYDTSFSGTNSIATALSGKSSTSHTHKTDGGDVTADTAASDLGDATDTMEFVTTHTSGYSSSTKLLYRRPATKIWNWIVSHYQVSIFKTSSDVYVRAGADADHCIYLDYDAVSGSTPVMGIWARWGSGSSAKWMARCDNSGNCIFNGNASSATTISGSQVMLPAHSSDGYIRVEQSGKAKTYLEAYDSKGGVWVNNGGVSGWLCYRDDSGTSWHTGGMYGIDVDTYNNSTYRVALGYGDVNTGTKECHMAAIVMLDCANGPSNNGSGITFLVEMNCRGSARSASAKILNDNNWSTSNKPAIITFLSDSDSKLHVCVGIANSSNVLQDFKYTKTRIIPLGLSQNFHWGVSADSVTTYNYLIPAGYGRADSFSTSVNAGSANQPVYFNNGVPTVCNWWVS